MTRKPSLVRRWRLYRRWGPRKTWNGNEVIDVAVKKVRTDKWYFAEGWSVCRCSKEFYVCAGAPSEVEVRMRIRLSDGLCRECQAWWYKLDNRCLDGNCTLAYAHHGRCAPFRLVPEVRERIMAELRRRELSGGTTRSTSAGPT